MDSVTELTTVIPQVGRVEWIGIASERRGTIQPQEAVEIRLDTGIVGEHHANRGNSNRQITLIQQEHLKVIASLCGAESVQPEQVRRNIAVSGINLLALKGHRFRVGDVTLQGTGHCVPCSRMEENLGPGGYNAMRGHGGLNAIVVTPGTIRLNDPVAFEPAETS